MAIVSSLIQKSVLLQAFNPFIFFTLIISNNINNNISRYGHLIIKKCILIHKIAEEVTLCLLVQVMT